MLGIIMMSGGLSSAPAAAEVAPGGRSTAPRLR